MDDAELKDLELAWQAREAEAKALEANFPAMSLSLRLYALEIRIKTKVCQKLSIDKLPKACRTHEINELIIFTGLSRELDDPARAALRKNWDSLAFFAKNQLNGIRYLPGNALSPSEVAAVLDALDDAQDGVWTWLSGHP
jgi:hypothetical protein